MVESQSSDPKLKKGSGVVVQSTLRAVPATTPAPFLKPPNESNKRLTERGVNVCQRLPASLRLGLTLSTIVCSSLLPVEHWPSQGLLMAVIFFGLSLAGITLRYLGRRLMLALPMLILFGLSFPLAGGGDRVWIWIVSLWFRCLNAFLAGLWLVHVLPLPELLRVLRRWRCPSILIAMLGFMYRYIFILWEELRRLQNARDARDFGSASTWLTWKTRAQLIGALMLRALERAERTHQAMLARGWDGTMRSLDD